MTPIFKPECLIYFETYNHGRLLQNFQQLEVFVPYLPHTWIHMNVIRAVQIPMHHDLLGSCPLYLFNLIFITHTQMEENLKQSHLFTDMSLVYSFKKKKEAY